MKNQIIENYLKEIYQKISRGDAREESFYGILEELISSFGLDLNKKTAVTTLPKKTEAGNPDFRVWDGQSKITGYIEAKNPSVKFLDEIEITEQIKRYLEAYPNVILTNFFEFRFYRNGVLYGKPVKISDYAFSQKFSKFPIVQNEKEFIKLLTFFFDFTQPRIYSSKTLAEILAVKAQIMKDYVVAPSLVEKEENYFLWLYKSFKTHLIKDLKEQDFADYFSQSFTYGLLIAKYQYEAQQTLFGTKISNLPFTTKTAYDYIQKNFGILREVFQVISTREMPKDLEIIVDDIVDILNNTEIYKIFGQSKKEGKKDPIFHLYETFLLKYDKEKKIRLGAFYTPLEVVSYVVNSVHSLLKDDKLFNASDGLASYKSDSLEKSITLLDPAVGTGTFFVKAIEKAMEEVKNKYSSNSDYESKFIREHILPHFYAFEISIAPYVVSHLKVLFTLTDRKFKFQDKDILKIFLTNTLEFQRKKAGGLFGPFEQTLVTEQKNALEVKNTTPIQIVIGNPPYSVSSQNEVDKETEFGKFYESYKENVRKEERNIQPLSDDYIKFLSFAHWKVKKAGKGIVGMITNNSYLDGRIHRDMRQKLLEDFDLIYILNLHGEANRAQNIENSVKDENVFDIRQGVAINIFVKAEKPTKKQIYYQELIDSRENKYKFLDNHDVKNSNLQELNPKDSYYFFVPKDFDSEEKYQKFYSVKDIFDKYNVGITTGKDEVLVNFTKDALIRKFSIKEKELLKLTLKDQVEEELIEKWYSELQKNNLQMDVLPYFYRPFDTRFTIYNSKILQRARVEIMNNMLSNNLALCMTNTTYQENYNEIFITNGIIDKHLTGAQTYIFPLWQYRSSISPRLINSQDQLGLIDFGENKILNFKTEFYRIMENRYSKITPEEIFYYIYAILYSDIYRKKYEEFLKIDFPKIPFTSDYKLFKELSSLGKELAGLHLLINPLLNKTSSKLEGSDGDYIKNPHYDIDNKQIYINDKEYFTNVESEVWNYYIGGYQVLSKWLKDRKDKILSAEDINHYIKMIESLKQTISIQSRIDKIYLEAEKRIIEK